MYSIHITYDNITIEIISTIDRWDEEGGTHLASYKARLLPTQKCYQTRYAVLYLNMSFLKAQIIIYIFLIIIILYIPHSYKPKYKADTIFLKYFLIILHNGKTFHFKMDNFS